MIRSANSKIRGKNKLGLVCDFYPENEIRVRCADLISILPDADESGCIKIGEAWYRTLKALSRVFGVTPKVVIRRIAGSSVKKIRGRLKTGGICDFYAEDSIQGIMGEVVSLRVADKSNWIRINGVRYGTVRTLARWMKVDADSLKHQIFGAGVNSIRGKDNTGHVRNFYSEADVAALLKFLLDSPKTDSDGFVEIGGGRHGSVNALCRLLKISEKAILRRIRSSDVKAKLGRGVSGRLVDLYPLVKVRKLCADLLVSLPRVGKVGFVQINGIQHGTIYSFAQTLGFDHGSISSRLNGAGIVQFLGKTNLGHKVYLYSEPAVREACRDLIERKKFNPKPR